MLKRVLIAFLIVVVLFGFWFAVKNNEPTESADRHKLTFYDYFNTNITITLYGEYTSDELEDIRLSIDEKLTPFNQLVDRFESYDTGDNLYDLNKNNEIAYDSDLATIIVLSTDYYNNVSNQLNIALGPVTDIWKFATEECNVHGVCKVPSKDTLEAAFVNNDPNLIVVTHDKITTSPGMIVDVGAVAKGYGADLIAETLKSNGIGNFIINAGGNIIGTQKSNGDPLIIGIRDPFNPSMDFTTLTIKDKAIVTSGDYENYFYADGNLYHHLINVDTLYPSTTFKSVTVIADESFIADCYSTMLFGMSLEEGLDVVNSTYGLEAIWVLGDGSVEKSNGASKFE